MSSSLSTHLIHGTAVWIALASAAGANGCVAQDKVYEASATLRSTTVTRESDGASVYDGCGVNRVGAALPSFAAAPGDALVEHVAIVERTKRTLTYNPGLDDYTNDAYWCSSTDNYGQDVPGSIGQADCYRAAAPDPPAVVTGATLEFDSSMTVPVAVSRSLQIKHAGTLTLEPNPPCPRPGPAPPRVDELTILE